MLARIKKAVVAGVGAGAGAALTHQVTIGWKTDSVNLGQTLGAFLAAGVPVGWATWKAKNAKPQSSYGRPGAAL